MAVHFGDLMARLRVAGVTGQLPPDLAREVLEELARRATPAERERLRNDLLGRAFAMVEGTAYARARALEGEIRKLTGVRCPIPDGRGGVRDLLIEALKVDPGMPRGWRQILRIADKACHPRPTQDRQGVTQEGHG